MFQSQSKLKISYREDSCSQEEQNLFNFVLLMCAFPNCRRSQEKSFISTKNYKATRKIASSLGFCIDTFLQGFSKIKQCNETLRNRRPANTKKLCFFLIVFLFWILSFDYILQVSINKISHLDWNFHKQCSSILEIIISKLN